MKEVSKVVGSEGVSWLEGKRKDLLNGGSLCIKMYQGIGLIPSSEDE